jgi:peptidoglycan L-alanyl-D-glutamate endopeptidase CwlK
MPTFGTQSLANRAKLHPLLQKLVDEMIKEIDFKVLDATRGRAAQTKAFLQGNSKAKFGQSAHNYSPAIAVDLFPAPYKWEGKEAEAAFLRLGAVGLRCAAKLGIPVRWGGDWNMDGSKTTSDAWDKPHFELNPWREYAKQSKLFED